MSHDRANQDRSNLSSPRVRAAIALAFVVAAVLLRVAPHPWNLAPIGGIAVFSGAAFGPRRGVAVALAAIIVSDLFVGLHDLIWLTWSTFALIALAAGRWLRPTSGPGSVFLAGLGSATTFFVVSNAGVWLQGELYPRTMHGLVDCYVAAIPFFRNSLIGDLFYCGLMFGGYRLAVAVAARVEATAAP